MRDFHDAKAMASTLRDELAARKVQLSRADCLEIISKTLGEADWNTLSARIKSEGAEPSNASGKDAPEEPRPDLMRPFYSRHLTAEERRGPWGKLFREAQALHAASTDPNSGEVLDLARRWLAQSHATTGGDADLSAKYAAAYTEALNDPSVAPSLPLSRELLQWFAPAMRRARSEQGD